MRTRKIISLAVLLCGTILITYRDTASSQTAKSENPNIAQLSWLAGDWESDPGGKAQIEEHWTKPSGGSMLGMSRTVAGDQTVEYEYLRIEQRADAIYYVAHPKARCPGTDFKLTRLSAQEALFENPEHDFPKRIIYRKGQDGSLTATIDGGEGTKEMSFPYRAMR